MLRSLGFTPTEADVEDMQSKAGASVNFDALLGFISAAKAKTIKEQDVTEALKVFDKDGNGFLKTDEVKRILSQLGEKLSAREVRGLLRNRKSFCRCLDGSADLRPRHLAPGPRCTF